MPLLKRLREPLMREFDVGHFLDQGRDAEEFLHLEAEHPRHQVAEELGLFAAISRRIAFVQNRPKDRSPEIIALRIGMQTVREEQVRPRPAILGQHGCEEVNEQQPVVGGGEFPDEAVGGLDAVQ